MRAIIDANTQAIHEFSAQPGGSKRDKHRDN
jgi:hypothetical protein